MIGTQFTLTNKADPTRTIVLNDHSSDNFVALQAYPTFDLDVRNDEIAKEGQHGIWDFFSFYGKRLITFEGVIVGETEADVHTLKETLQQITELPVQPTTGDDGTVIISWTDPLGRDVQTEAKIATSIRFSRAMRETYKLDFILTLKSANSMIESQELILENGLRGYPLAGLTLPFTLPDLLSTTLVNKFNVENDGTTVADITFTMYGSANRTINNPVFTNLTTGNFIQINTVLADETEYVTVDTRTGTIVDQDGNDMSGLLETGSSFPRLAIGVNEILYTSDESTGPDSPPVTHVEPDEIVETEHRDAII
jgi:hypothetical protein